tara:strand:+ start:204 stop:392 length:189 start_codon:yes stop_codon:yes gene_type:complete
VKGRERKDTMGNIRKAQWKNIGRLGKRKGRERDGNKGVHKENENKERQLPQRAPSTWEQRCA